jgi:hypothetical protein
VGLLDHVVIPERLSSDSTLAQASAIRLANAWSAPVFVRGYVPSEGLGGAESAAFAGYADEGQDLLTDSLCRGEPR